jgi:plasmid stability protein
MKNITITLDAETARRARVRAAERNMSVSRYVGELLRKDIRESREYEEAMRAFFSRGPYKELTGAPQRYATREELHDRAALRGK